MQMNDHPTIERVTVQNAPQYPGWEYTGSTLYGPYRTDHSWEGPKEHPGRVVHGYVRDFPGKFEGDQFPLPCGHGRVKLDYSIHSRICKKCGNDYNPIALSNLWLEGSDRKNLRDIVGGTVYFSLSITLPKGTQVKEAE